MRISKINLMSPSRKIMVFNAKPSLKAHGGKGFDVNKINARPDQQIIMINTGKERSECEDKPVVGGTCLELFTPEDWPAVLRFAADKKVKVVLLNWLNEEVFFKAEDIRKGIPSTVPGQLLAFLHTRFKAFDGKEEDGLEIMFAALSKENAERVKGFIVELAHLNGLEYAFLDWLETVNQFIVEP